MPETYTQEQISEAVRECDRFAEKHYDKEIAPYVEILSYALSTAEKNNADWQEYNAELLHRAETAEQERDALAARCAELEARLQGAADRAMKWQIKLCEADDWSCENCTECTDLRTAILGEKKE